ncbi:hypothetical protein NQ318_006380 [Aromia moschata]|uniref:Plancitoxin-1 n=1 Tax=Aromia moschata TaxID=1265417 RepID=A0AAV8YJC6_9CUCU|nr:hypothetical protein NQ318_006380 [Aromia moschata]
MKFLLLIYILNNLLFYTNSLQCIDENNNPVDWFIAYKLPEIKHHHKLLKAGVAYMYMTSVDNQSWTFSNLSINATNSIIANTLQGLYNGEKNISYILYNDEPEGKKKSNKGHTKGVVMANSTSGFWLIHSVPHFPILGKTYIYPRTGAVYGQSFLCISMDLNNLNKAGIQLQYNNPEIYLQNIDVNLKTSLPDLVKAAENITVNVPPWYNVINLLSLGEFSLCHLPSQRVSVKTCMKV